MPVGSDVVNCGWVQLDEPVGGGAAALPDGDGDMGWLLVDALGLGVFEFRDVCFGITATWGAAASGGITVADVLLTPLRPPVLPLVSAAAFAPGAGPCPAPRKLTAASPPPANTAAAVTPMITPRESGRPRDRGLPVPRVTRYLSHQ